MPLGGNGSDNGISLETHGRSEQPSPASGSPRRNRPRCSPIERQGGPKSGANRSAPTSTPATPVRIRAEHPAQLAAAWAARCHLVTEQVGLHRTDVHGQTPKALICRACRGRSAPISLISVRYSDHLFAPPRCPEPCQEPPSPAAYGSACLSASPATAAATKRAKSASIAKAKKIRRANQSCFQLRHVSGV